MKKIVLGVILLLILQGCSRFTLPKQEKVSVQIPAVSTSPAALVCINGKAAVLEMNGNLSNISSMYSNNRDFRTYCAGSKKYFLLQNKDLTRSLWVYDLDTKMLSCLVPELKTQNYFENCFDYYIKSFTVTEGEDYLLYHDSIYYQFYLFGSFYKEKYHLYSIKNQKTIKIPNFIGQDIVELKPLQEKGQYLIITNNYKETFVYKWDISQKKTKQVAHFKSERYSISRDGNWLVALEEKTLNRYSLFDGQKNVLRVDLSNADFGYVGNQSTLLVCQYNNSLGAEVNLMSPDQQWITFLPEEGNYVGFFAEIKPSLVYFKTFNRTTEEFKVVLWNPDRNEFNVVFKSKTVEISESFKISNNGNYLIIDGNLGNTGFCRLFIDLEKKTCKLVKEKDLYNPIDASNNNAIWFYHNIDTPPLGSLSDRINYFIYDLNENKQYQLKTNTKDYVLQAYTDNNGDYLYMFLNEKDRFYDVQTGKEITIPGLNKENNNFTFITWLD